MNKLNHQEILMCPPTYYAIEYKINPWMISQVNQDKAQQQWQDLKKIFENLGIKVSLITPVKYLPDMVFTADQGVVYKEIFIKSNFYHPQRQRESLYTLHWFKEKGFTIVELPKSACFEGQGDLLFLNETILIGIGQRTNKKAAKIIKRLFNKEVIMLRLIDPYFFHLDTALCPLSNKAIMLYQKAFDVLSLRKIKKLGLKIIFLEKEDAFKMACNSIVYKNHIIINKGCSQELLVRLQNEGFSVIEIDISEFIKSGGGARCLTWNPKLT